MSYSRQICVLSGHPRNQVSASALKCEGGGCGGRCRGGGGGAPEDKREPLLSDWI